MAARTTITGIWKLCHLRHVMKKGRRRAREARREGILMASKPPSPRADQLRKQREEKYEAEQKRQADEKKRKRKKPNQPQPGLSQNQS
jgi:hypothetical protein